MSDIPWLDVAWRYLGVGEIPGPADSPDVLRFHASVDAAGAGDDVAWCSAFVNSCMEEAGLEGTDSRAARSWLAWGVPLTEPRYGCVCVLWRGSPDSWKGHVGLWIDEVGDEIVLLGGNQGNRVGVARYPKSRVLGYRWCDGEV